MKERIRYIIVFIFALLIATQAFSQSNKDKFSQGVTQYTAGNYQEALESWMNIYNTGFRSADLNYNIGNAYFKLNNIPAAILFYERAYLLDPSDENINYNLEIARSMTVDRFQAIPELFFVRWYDFISLFLHANTWAVISLISFVLCLVFISLYIYTSRYNHKVTGFWLAVVLVIISVGSIMFSLHNKSLVYDSQKAIISIPQVSGKSSPDNSGTDLFVLHEGTKVSLEDEVGEWYEIRLSDGNKGWIPVNSLIVI